MVALPAWVQEGGIEPTLERLADPADPRPARTEWFPAPTQYPLEKMHLAMVADPDWRWAEGKTVTEAAEEAGLSPVRLHLRHPDRLGPGRRRGRTSGPTTGPRRTSGPSSATPRTWRARTGSSAGASRIPEAGGRSPATSAITPGPSAITPGPRRSTHLSAHAARRYRLTDRGLVRPGFVADLAVFDPATVTDRSTYADGRTLAEGVRHVVVNGILALENGEPTGATPGRALRRG